MSDIEKVIPRMRKLGRILSKYTMVERKDFDFGIGLRLYPAEVHMLSAVDNLGGCGVSELAREAGVTKGAVSQLVTKLVNKKLLKKEPDPLNGSRVIIMTTGLGKKASDKHYEFHMDHDRKFIEYLDGLGDEELAVFDELCSKMDDWMDSYLD